VLAIDRPSVVAPHPGVLNVTEADRRPDRPARNAARNADRHPASSPAGTSRAGRRGTDRPRHDEVSLLERLRTPVLALVVIAAVVGIGLFAFTSATAPVYACTTIDTIQPPVEGQIGQVQPDMGNGHVNIGDKITYPVCPPASGKHINKTAYGPLEPKVYGPEDQSAPNGWVHNLEHGGLVLLYSCAKGACDDASLAALREFSSGFPPSAICKLPAGQVGPVIAKFDEMPARYAALVWDRVFYFDTLDDQKVYSFFLEYAERVSSDGTWISPPEQRCPAPTSTPAASPTASPGPTGG
jgi:hypothetical protein